MDSKLCFLMFLALLPLKGITQDLSQLQTLAVEGHFYLDPVDRQELLQLPGDLAPNLGLDPTRDLPPTLRNRILTPPLGSDTGPIAPNNPRIVPKSWMEQRVDEEDVQNIALKLRETLPDPKILDGAITSLDRLSQTNTCRNAFDKLENAENACGGHECAKHRGKRALASQLLVSTYDAAAAVFDRSCLINVGADKFWAETDQLSKTKQVAAKVLGVITSPHVTCGGLLINNNTVLTARHCFYKPKDRRKKSPSYRDIKKQSVYFYKAGEPDKKYLVTSLIGFDEKKTGGIHYSEDYVLLTLSTPIADLPSIVFDDPIPGEQHWLVGYYIYHDKSWHSSRIEYNEENRWFHGLRTSKTGTCFIETSKQGCILHTCQSERGFSGGPMINLARSTEENLVVSGLLVSSAESNQACSSTTNMRNALNLAVGASLFLSDITPYLNNE